jgi:hypothetical protein
MRSIAALIISVQLLIILNPQSAVASVDRATANCDGHQVVGAAHITRTDNPGIALGSIQLCRKYFYGQYELFARVQTYYKLPRGQWANAYFHYAFPDHTVVTCDTNGGHVVPGGTTCRTGGINEGVCCEYAEGRIYVSNGAGGWRLIGHGSTRR